MKPLCNRLLLTEIPPLSLWWKDGCNVMTGISPRVTLSRKFFLRAKEPDLRGERNELGSLKQQYPVGIQHGEAAGAPAETPLPGRFGLHCLPIC